MNASLSGRARTITKPILRWYKKQLPPISPTERDAIAAGTVWWDAELFSGKPQWAKLRGFPKPQLTAEEQMFLDGPVEKLCSMLNDWDIRRDCDLPEPVWAFIRDRGFMGMIIPKEHGGLGFSALMHSHVVMKVASRSPAAAVTVMVPNSLGPAELLMRYGTDAQRDYYLPRLAKGVEIPCFALTAPEAGSDAASIPDRAIVCYGEHKGQRVLGLRVTWNKRYITLAPVATILGLAFKLYDPDHLIGEREDIGITLGLVPTNTPGVQIGRRHFPADQSFQNGPTQGKDVFIPMDYIIGGQARVGQGWRMLMDCLAAGRAISLPALGTGAAMFCARLTGAYARVRRQFGMPIGKFEGIEEPLARIAGYAYGLDAARRLTAASLDSGQQPSVLSAILKYHATERMRTALNDAMDIHGGRAICDGPRNYLFGTYMSVPVAITVEGANILTRSLIIFGQGAIRCHPYLLKEMEAANLPDPNESLAVFDRVLFAHIFSATSNVTRAFLHNLTGGIFARVPDVPRITPLYRGLHVAAVTFAAVADLVMGTLGGAMKRRESLSARLGDILSELYLMSCALKRYEDEGAPASGFAASGMELPDRALLHSNAAGRGAEQSSQPPGRLAVAAGRVSLGTVSPAAVGSVGACLRIADPFGDGDARASDRRHLYQPFAHRSDGAHGSGFHRSSRTRCDRRQDSRFGSGGPQGDDRSGAVGAREHHHARRSRRPRAAPMRSSAMPSMWMILRRRNLPGAKLRPSIPRRPPNDHSQA